MGLYDTFVADARCPNCHQKYRARFQTKDFGCLLESIEQGEDVRRPVDTWFLHKSALFDRKFTARKARGLVARNPKKYQMSASETGKRPWVEVYQNLGKRKRGFADVKEARFEVYDTCPECKTWIEGTGVIKNYIFRGVVGLMADNESTSGKKATRRVRRRVKLVVRESRGWTDLRRTTTFQRIKDHASQNQKPDRGLDRKSSVAS